MEHMVPLKHNKKYAKQNSRRFTPQVNLKIKVEIWRLIKVWTTRYVEYVCIIVQVIKKNDSLIVCIYFIDLNVSTS